MPGDAERCRVELDIERRGEQVYMLRRRYAYMLQSLYVARESRRFSFSPYHACRGSRKCNNVWRIITRAGGMRCAR